MGTSFPVWPLLLFLGVGLGLVFRNGRWNWEPVRNKMGWSLFFWFTWSMIVLLGLGAMFGIQNTYGISAIIAGIFVLPAVAYPRLKQKKIQRVRVAQGLCVKCAYDLRGSSERCPECGWNF